MAYLYTVQKGIKAISKNAWIYSTQLDKDISETEVQRLLKEVCNVKYKNFVLNAEVIDTCITDHTYQWDYLSTTTIDGPTKTCVFRVFTNNTIEEFNNSLSQVD